ncbi:hypothetical protein PENANT_c011G07917 [Penicillium antarcticum]|uniref:NmrA-like domain-containing protein n=1 Tax=Penicillium antarcticum TaxID=416450 RepID=A0A1V6Q7B7_9EURO|nr:hypothetical protein PENANT_c011G07917 [Penicillium antarcticum]
MASVLIRHKWLTVGKDEKIWQEIHIQDLTNLHLALGDAAAARKGKTTWGDEGYYLPKSGSVVWDDIQRAVAQAAFDQKLTPSPEAGTLSEAQLFEIWFGAMYAWGKSIHANRVLD